MVSYLISVENDSFFFFFWLRNTLMRYERFIARLLIERRIIICFFIIGMTLMSYERFIVKVFFF